MGGKFFRIGALALAVGMVLAASGHALAPKDDGTGIAAASYRLRWDVPVFDLIADNGMKPGWRWRREGDLPLPWPELYRANGEEFNPYTFLLNARIIAAKIKAGDEAETFRRALPYLLRQLERYSTVEPGGFAFVTYEFAYDCYGRMVPAGWRSAFGNAAVMLGLLDLYRSTGDAALLARARAYLLPLLSVDRSDGVTVTDKDHYLWFEEYPSPVSHVINGHIGVLLALYEYEQLTGDRSLRQFIAAGLTTMRHYLPVARHPGHPSAYGLFDLAQADYGPARIVNYVRAIAAISGDPQLGALAADYAADMAGD